MKPMLQLRSGKRAPCKVERSPNLPKDLSEAPELDYLPDQFEDRELSRLPPGLNYFQNTLKVSKTAVILQGPENQAELDYGTTL